MLSKSKSSGVCELWRFLIKSVTGTIMPMVAAVAIPALVRSLWEISFGFNGMVWLGFEVNVVRVGTGEGLGDAVGSGDVEGFGVLVGCVFVDVLLC